MKKNYHIFYWEENEDSLYNEDDLTVEDKVKRLETKNWKIVSVCITEFRTNGIKNRATKAIIICHT